jgi:hypothetical protein
MEGFKHIELIHILMIGIHVSLNDLHRFKMFQPGLFADLVLPVILIILQMAHIGNIPYISHLIPLRWVRYLKSRSKVMAGLA